MACSEVTILTIQGSECVGDSLVKINSNFSTLENAACDLYGEVGELNTKVLQVSGAVGLNFPILVNQGGTGATTASLARANLGAVNKAGDTMTGFLTLNANPTSNLHAATKQYVDSAAFVVGQTWQTFTVSGASPQRTAGVTYTNSTGKPILVVISNYRVASVGYSTFIINGTVVARTRNGGDNTVGTTSTTTLIVPNGSTYSMTSNGLDTWSELR